jgi:hypothetical protein
LAAPAGMGDCLLINFPLRFFAVADGSDRNPSISKEFMKKFDNLLTGILSSSHGRIYEEKEIKRVKRQLIAESHQLLQTLSFGDSCTFTGILLLRTTEGIIGLFFHTGDSLLFSCNVETGRTRQWSKNNFWMVGRTSHFFQVEERPLKPPMRLLLATDGLTLIPISPLENREVLIRTLFQNLSPDEIPDRLLESHEISVPGWDDMAIITLNPYALPVLEESFLIGGTSRIEEGVFREEQRQGLWKDQYLPLEEKKETGSKPVDL